MRMWVSRMADGGQVACYLSAMSPVCYNYPLPPSGECKCNKTTLCKEPIYVDRLGWERGDKIIEIR